MRLKLVSSAHPLLWSTPKKQTLRTRLAIGMSLLFMVQSIALMLFVNVLSGEGLESDLSLISVIGLFLAALIGAAGSYWLSGVLLRPLRKVSRAAHLISANTLHTRLGLSGPPDEVKELADAFDAMLNRLEQAFEQQSRFVADAAHELRTPLAIMHSQLELVLSNPHSILKDYQAMSCTLQRSIFRLEHLVDDLLFLAKVEQSSLTQTELDLLAILEDVLVELDAMAQSRQVRVHLEAEQAVRVKGEISQLRRVFLNLLENAIRYNQPEGGGQVWVSLQNSPGSKKALVQIRDNGPGIPGEAQPHLFERFFRVEQSRSRHKGGAGLGLSIVAQIVQLHFGEIELIKSDEQGSLFEVRLPRL